MCSPCADIHHAIRSGHPLGALAKSKDEYLEDTGRCPLKCRKLPVVSSVWSKLPKQCCGKKPKDTDPLQVRRVTRTLESSRLLSPWYGVLNDKIG
jgi:hypothetical protein